MKTRNFRVTVLVVVLCLGSTLLLAQKDKAPAAAAVPAGFAPSAAIMSIDIKAPVGKVFAYIDDSASITKWMTGIKTVTNIKGKGVGKTFDWAAELEGVKLAGDAMVLDHVPNKKITATNSIGDVWTAVFKSNKGGGTTLIVSQQTFLGVPNLKLETIAAARAQHLEALKVSCGNIKANLEK